MSAFNDPRFESIEAYKTMLPVQIKIFHNEPKEFVIEHRREMEFNYVYLIQLVSKHIKLKFGLAKNNSLDLSELGFYAECFIQSKGSKDYYEVKENFVMNPKDISSVLININPMNQGAFVGGFGGAVAGAQIGGAIGSFVPLIGNVVGALAGAGIGTLVGGIGGYLYQDRLDINKELRSQAAKATSEFLSVTSLTPIKPNKIKKLESRQIDRILSDNRLSPGSVVPEIYGNMRVIPGSLTPFYRRDQDKLSRGRVRNEYRSYYSVGEGPLEIFSQKLGETLSPRDFNSGNRYAGDFERDVDVDEGSDTEIIFQPPAVSLSSEDFVLHDVPETDQTGLLYSYESEDQLGRLDLLTLLLTYTNDSTDPVSLPEIDYDGDTFRVPPSWSWFFRFYALESVHLTLEEAEAAANAIAKGIAIESPINGLNGFLTLRPTALLPIFLIEITYPSGSNLDPDINLDDINLTNKSERSVYDLYIPTPEEINSISERSFVNFDMEINSRRFEQRAESFRVWRIGYNEISSGSLRIGNFGSVSDNFGNGNIIILHNSISIIRNLFMVSNSFNEATIEYNQEITTPEFPFIPDPYIPPTPVNLTFETFNVSGGTGRYTALTPESLRDQNRYNDDLRIYNENTEQNNDIIIEEEEAYKDDLQEFNQRLRTFTRLIGTFSVEVERRIRDVLNGNPDDYIFTENPAEIVCHILFEFIQRSNIELSVFDLIDRDQFLEWFNFCETEDLEFNGVFDFESSVFDVINQIAFIGLADLDYSAGKIKPIIRRKRSIIKQFFHTRNINNFVMNKTYKEVPDVLIGEFINKSLFFKPDETRHYLNGNDASSARTSERLRLFGCTNRSQAGVYLDAQRRIYEDDGFVYSFQTSLDAIVSRIGDLVAINYFEIDNNHFSARVASLILNEDKTQVIGIQLDQESIPNLLRNFDYGCQILTEAGNPLELMISGSEITQVESEQDNLLDRDLTPLGNREGDLLAARPRNRQSLIFQNPEDVPALDTISIGDYVIFGLANNIIKKCLVNSYSLDQDLNVNVTLTSYNDDLFAY